jgi:S1-C subfamily serine protease
MRMTCTATAYRTVQEKDKSLDTRLVSAAHCVSGDSDKEQKQTKFYVSADHNGTKAFIPVEVVAVGDKKQGDDFVILKAKGTDFHLTQLGDSSKTYLGENVIDVSAPFGLGKNYYQGYVSNTTMDRPPLDAGGVKWTELELVSIGGGPGSSGSAVVSVDQKAITGFLVGRIPGEEIGFMCIPVNKFKAFEDGVDKGTYKKIKASDSLHDEAE